MQINHLYIDGIRISEDSPPYLVAEMSASHNGVLGNAKKLILSAKPAGAQAIKIQSYTADTITLNCKNRHFQIDSGLWKGRTLYDLYT